MNLNFIGTIKEPKGLSGEIEIINMPDGLIFPPEGTLLYIGYSSSFAENFKLRSWRKVKDKTYIIIEGIDSPEIAKKLRDLGVFVDDDYLSYDDNFYLVQDLIGCKVFDSVTGDEIGIIHDVMILPGNDVWLIDTDEGELPVPVIKDVIKSVDILTKKVIITVPDGLYDLINRNFKSKQENGYDEN